MNPALIPRKIDEGLVARKVNEDLLIVDQDNGKIHQLNISAAFIWEQCDGKNAIGEITAKTFEKFEIDPDKAREDVHSTLENLTGLNLIKLQEH
jgi:hypothetical protein